jgi:hypothetical protein
LCGHESGPLFAGAKTTFSSQTNAIHIAVPSPSEYRGKWVRHKRVIPQPKEKIDTVTKIRTFNKKNHVVGAKSRFINYRGKVSQS